jgi:hypothetical protein
MEKRDCRNGVEASWGAVRGRGPNRESDDWRRTTVNNSAYDKDVTALLVVDPYNDFISEAARSGLASRLWPKLTTASATCWRFSTPRAG